MKVYTPSFSKCYYVLCYRGMRGRSLNFYRREANFIFSALGIHKRAEEWQAYLQLNTFIP